MTEPVDVRGAAERRLRRRAGEVVRHLDIDRQAGLVDEGVEVHPAVVAGALQDRAVLVMPVQAKARAMLGIDTPGLERHGHDQAGPAEA